MRIGVLVRCDDRGLGVQSRAVAKALNGSPLVVVPEEGRAAGFVQHTHRFPNAPVVSWCRDGSLQPLETVREWLRTIDVCYSAETFYDPTFVQEAKAAGVATVLHVNPELFRAGWDPPTRLWLPTVWRQELFEGCPVVPMPVETDEAPGPAEAAYRPVLVHTVGRAALADRNGTETFCESLGRLRGPCEVRLFTQEDSAPQPRCGPDVSYSVLTGGVKDRWAMYKGGHLLVLPRRYGGNCLPVGEAMASGLAVVMPAVPPNTDWPIQGFAVRGSRPIRMVGGRVPVVSISPQAVADAVQDLLNWPEKLEAQRQRSLKWAAENSWGALRPVWLKALTDVL